MPAERRDWQERDGPDRDTPSIPRDGREVSTKLWSITLRAREDPTCKFTSLAHLLTADFPKECFRELKKDKAPGIDGVTWRKYEENLDVVSRDMLPQSLYNRHFQ